MTQFRTALRTVVLLLLWAGVAGGETTLTVFAAQASSGNIEETTFRLAGTLDAYFVGVDLGQSLQEHGRLARWEVEGQVVKHFGLQHQWEATGALVLRWLALPWDRWVDTSIAVGDGLSWGSRHPWVEVERHEHTQRILNYLFFEMTFSPPGGNPWSLVLRQHHRSGVYGVYGGVRGGSDFLAVGLRRSL